MRFIVKPGMNRCAPVMCACRSAMPSIAVNRSRTATDGCAIFASAASRSATSFVAHARNQASTMSRAFALTSFATTFAKSDS